jgi:hypothetical protein
MNQNLIFIFSIVCFIINIVNCSNIDIYNNSINNNFTNNELNKLNKLNKLNSYNILNLISNTGYFLLAIGILFSAYYISLFLIALACFLLMFSIMAIIFIIVKISQTFDMIPHILNYIKNQFNIILHIRSIKEKKNNERIREEIRNKINPEENIPFDMLCPITHDIMLDPVICDDGHSYEYEALNQAIRLMPISPITRQRITITIHNRNLKGLIINFLRLKGCKI